MRGRLVQCPSGRATGPWPAPWAHSGPVSVWREVTGSLGGPVSFWAVWSGCFPRQWLWACPHPCVLCSGLACPWRQLLGASPSLNGFLSLVQFFFCLIDSELISCPLGSGGSPGKVPGGGGEVSEHSPEPRSGGAQAGGTASCAFTSPWLSCPLCLFLYVSFLLGLGPELSLVGDAGNRGAGPQCARRWLGAWLGAPPLPAGSPGKLRARGSHGPFCGVGRRVHSLPAWRRGLV